MVLGRDCSALVSALEPAPAGPSWSYTRALAGELGATSSPINRAILIEQIDRMISATGRPVQPAPGETPRRLTDFRLRDLEESRSATFYGGVMHISHRYCEDFITSFDGPPRACWSHHLLEVPSYPSGSWFPDLVEVDGFPVARQLAAADSGPFRIIVVRGKGSAYDVWASADEGKHWVFKPGPANTRLVASWQDPDTGRIDLIIRGLDHVYRHRLSPSAAPTVRKISLMHDWFPAGLDVDCRHGEVGWSLAENHVIEIGDDVRRWPLHGIADHAEIDCRDDTAIVLRRNPDVLERCGAGCDVVFAPRFQGHGVVALAGDRTWVYALAVDRIVAVWREGRKHVELYRFDEPRQLRGLTILEGQAWVVTAEATIARL